MDTATAVKESSIFDPGAFKVEETNVAGLSPDVPRYAFVPLTRKPVPGTDFRTADGHLPVNQMFVMRSFSNTITDVANGGKRTVARPAADQVADVQRIASREGAVDFPEIAQLQDKEGADQIWAALENPHICVKYPDENGTTCMTCWGTYLAREAPAAIAELPYALQATANATLERLQESTGRAQIFATDQFRLSVDAIEGNQKRALSAQDRINMRHAHLEEPNFSGVMGQATGLGAEIAKGITDAMGAPKMDTEAIANIIAEQLAPMQESMAKLKAENAILKGHAEPQKATCAGFKNDGAPCNGPAGDNGFCRHHTPETVETEIVEDES